MKRTTLRRLKKGVYAVGIGIIILTGVVLYRAFMSYVPGGDLNELFKARLGMELFPFLGISALVMLVVPVILIAFSVYYRLSRCYLVLENGDDTLTLSEDALCAFVDAIIMDSGAFQPYKTVFFPNRRTKIGFHLRVLLKDAQAPLEEAAKLKARVLSELNDKLGIDSVSFIEIVIEDYHKKGAGHAANAEKEGA